MAQRLLLVGTVVLLSVLVLNAEGMRSWPGNLDSRKGSHSSDDVSVLRSSDLSRREEDESTRIALVPNNNGVYDGRIDFQAPVPTDETRHYTLRVTVNFRSPPQNEQLWRFQFRNFRTNKWKTVGNNAENNNNRWRELVFRKHDLDDLVGDLGVMRMRIHSKGSSSALIDFLKVNFDHPARPDFDDIFARKSYMGLNLGGIRYWSSGTYFKNAMKQAGPWRTGDSADGVRWSDDIYADQVPLRSDGYPTVVPFAVEGTDLLQYVVSSIVAQSHRTGHHHVFYEGTGAWDMIGPSLVSEEAGHRTYDFSASAHLRILESDESDPLRSFVVVADSDLDSYMSQPFNEKLQTSIGEDTKVIRLMDIIHANNNPSTGRNSIPTEDYFSYSAPDSPPVEVLMGLTNHLRANPWITIPHMATDSYVRRFANRVYDNMDSNRYVFLEYSNEIWNSIFSQTRWAGEQGCADPVTRVEDEEGDCIPWTSAQRFKTKRTLEIFGIFKDVFGRDSTRVVLVLSGFAANSWITERALIALNDPAINPEGYQIDAVAIAPYFGANIDEELADFFLTATWEELRSYTSDIIQERRSWLQSHKQLADEYGAELIAYEGGQHFLCAGSTCEDEEFMAKLAEFQRHDIMEELYREYYQSWFEEGGSLFCTFSHIASATSRYGAWGLIESYDQPLSETPKLRAYLEAAATYGYVAVQ